MRFRRFYCYSDRRVFIVAPDVARTFSIRRLIAYSIASFDLFERRPEGRNDSSAILRPATLAGVVTLQTPFFPFNQSQK